MKVMCHETVFDHLPISRWLEVIYGDGGDCFVGGIHLKPLHPLWGRGSGPPKSRCHPVREGGVWTPQEHVTSSGVRGVKSRLSAVMSPNTFRASTLAFFIFRFPKLRCGDNAQRLVSRRSLLSTSSGLYRELTVEFPCH